MSNRAINWGTWNKLSTGLAAFGEVESHLTSAADALEAHIMDNVKKYAHEACLLIGEARRKIGNHDINDAWNAISTVAKRYTRQCECGVMWFHMAAAAKAMLSIDSSEK